MKITSRFVLALSLILSGSAFAAMEKVTMPTLVSTAGQNVQGAVGGAVESANTKCFDLANAQGMGAAGAAAGNTAGVQTGQALAGAQAASGNSAAAALANQNVVKLCDEAIYICGKAVVSATGQLKVQYTNHSNLKNAALMANNTTEANNQNIQMVEIDKDVQQLQALQKTCRGTYGFRSAAAQGDTSMSVKALKEAEATRDALANGKGTSENVGDWLADNKGKVALGVLGGIALHNMTNGGGGGNSDADKAAELARAAAADPTCQSDRSYEFSHCQKYLKSLCAKPTEMEASKCKKFADNYCGYNQPEPAAGATPPTPEGLGTQLCQDTLAQRYCTMADRQACYSCLDIRDKSTATCQMQPAACVRTPSDADMVSYKTKCPDDPVFTQTKWAHIQVPGSSGSGAVSTSSAKAGAAGIIGSVGTSTYGSASFASQSAASLPADISPSAGLSVLAQNTQVIQKLCTQGTLNNCGARQINQ